MAQIQQVASENRLETSGAGLVLGAAGMFALVLISTMFVAAASGSEKPPVDRYAGAAVTLSIHHVLVADAEDTF